MKYAVYILELEDESYYVGHTNNLERRFVEHRMGIGCEHTKKHPAKRVVWSEEHDTRISAAKREREIKGWSRKKKEKLWKEASSS